jgi:hypothetical protein
MAVTHVTGVNNKNIKHAANPNEGVTRIRWNQRELTKESKMEKNEEGYLFLFGQGDNCEVGEEGGRGRRDRSGRGKYMEDRTWEAREQRERI